MKGIEMPEKIGCHPYKIAYSINFVNFMELKSIKSVNYEELYSIKLAYFTEYNSIKQANFLESPDPL
jgi:hypothetical protein